MKTFTTLSVVAATIALTVTTVLAQPVNNVQTFVPYLQVRFNATSSCLSSYNGQINRDCSVMIPSRLQQEIYTIERFFSLSDDELDRLQSVGPPDLPDLKLWSIVRLLSPTKTLSERFAKDLRKVPGIDVVNVITNGPPPPPIAAASRNLIRSRRTQATPNYQDLQTYLNAAPEGIDAKYMWSSFGGNGSKVKIYDIEYGWDQRHEDLRKSVRKTPVLVSKWHYYVKRDPDHGTAVLGELIGDATNTFGVTGIVPNASIGLGARWVKNKITDFWVDKTADVIMLALKDSTPGDVILLEAQSWVCKAYGGCGATQEGCGPVEWDDAVFAAIRVAVANNVAVVEAAGNGQVNLDQASCKGKFNREKRDSGAIIVGGGAAPQSYYTTRSTLWYSDYGSRVDMQGYGDQVATTGYGDLQNIKNRDYTDDFGGTSSASPIVAGAVASIQSHIISYLGKPLPPKMIRKVRIFMFMTCTMCGWWV
jgi:serine protease